MSNTKPDADGRGGEAAVSDPTMTKLPGKPSGENVPPAGGESMAPADSRHPYAVPGKHRSEDDATGDQT